jgi:hypothetical protein
MTQTTQESSTKAIEEAIAQRRGTARKPPTTIWYWVREYSESAEFPEVHMFATEEEARRTMITEALEAAAHLDGWITDEMDGPAITVCLQNQWGTFHQRVTALNVEREGGAVDCFRLTSQQITI